MKPIRLLRLAQIELDEAVAYYESQVPDLGEAFLDEFISGTSRIQAFPESWNPFSKDTRRCLLRRFPYGLVYSIEHSEIVIIAVAHLHREPGYWHNRV
jgi:plasmid stabilization system protein ParE